MPEDIQRLFNEANEITNAMAATTMELAADINELKALVKTSMTPAEVARVKEGLTAHVAALAAEAEAQRAVANLHPEAPVEPEPEPEA